MTGRGVGRTEHEWLEGLCKRRAQGKCLGERCLLPPQAGTQPTGDLVIQARRGAPDSVPTYLTAPCPLHDVNEAIALAGLLGEQLSKCPGVSARPGFHSCFSKKRNVVWYRELLLPPGNILEPPHPSLQPSFCWYKKHLVYNACKINPSFTDSFHSLEGDYEVLANYRNCIKAFPKNVSA